MRKLFFTMVILICTAIQAGAQSNDTRLTMSFNNEDLTAVFLRLEKSSDYKFLFTYDDVQKYKVNGQVKDAKFMDIVAYVLKGKPFDYKVDGKFIKVTLRSAKQNDQTKRKTYGGYVFDKEGEPIIGAQVKVKGTNVVSVTDIVLY